MDCEPVRLCGTKAAGLDWGTESFLTIADAESSVETISNPRLGRRMARRLRGAHRDLSRKERGSRNRRKAKQRLARLYRRLRNQRQEFLHQTTNRLVRTYGMLATESLNVRGMTAAGGRHKRGLNREILNTAPCTFLKILSCKAEEAGGWYVEFSPRHIKPTQTCYACGRPEKKSLANREHVCPCGVRCSRDEDAARVLVHWALIGKAPGSERARCGELSAGLDHAI